MLQCSNTPHHIQAYTHTQYTQHFGDWEISMAVVFLQKIILKLKKSELKSPVSAHNRGGVYLWKNACEIIMKQNKTFRQVKQKVVQFGAERAGETIGIANLLIRICSLLFTWGIPVLGIFVWQHWPLELEIIVGRHLEIFGWRGLQ